MNKRIIILAGLCLGLLVSTGTFASNPSDAQLRDDPYPLEYWALRSVINNAQVSPDGKYLGLMKIPSKTANPIIEVYEAANLDKEPFRIGADKMEVTSFYWASDKDIVFTLRQQVRDKIEGFNQGVYETRLAVADVEKKKMRSFDESGPAIENLLPNKPSKIIISFQEGDPDGPGAKLDRAFRPRAYWEFDLDKGTKKLLIRGKISVAAIEFDGNGDPWLARGFDLAKGEYIWYWRAPGSKKQRWEEIYRLSEENFESFTVEGLDEGNPGHILVAANNGHDKVGLWSYDVGAQKFDELIYRRNDVDVAGVRFHSNEWTNPDTVVAVAYGKDRFHYEYFDELEGATYSQLEQLIPSAYQLRINSRSRDGAAMTIFNTGPHDPGSYYLLKDGRIKSVGSRQPLLESEKLADVNYIEYEARDGRMIPGYVTVPNGKGPWPLIVMPHGGPFVAETVVYDEWSQMFANNGYMVVQPQYRGSFGHGLEFHKESFINGGQGGHMMQDDKDDAALYLVREGLADPDRLAMFGWSYGGYAALVAATREDQIYQCVIAGAAVADQLQQINYYRYQLRGAQKVRQLAYRNGSVNPIEEAAKVNVPMLIIHGDVDQRVPVTHANRYRRELDKHGISHKYVELEGADHFSSTLFYRHQIKLYESMIDFLKNDCGPGGL
jgi:dipeptidyl aminopeptidase/acylaminoacyl peptidase